MNKKLLALLLLFFSCISFAQGKLTGTITAVKGKFFTMKFEGDGSALAKGDSCSVSKDISGSKNIFGIKVTNGWLGVGTVLVTAIEKNKITLKIVKETSNIVINGKKTEHFVPGKIMRLE